MEDADGGFRVVSRKRGKKKKLNSSKEDVHFHPSNLSVTSDIDVPSLITKIRHCVNDLQISRFFNELKETWQTVQLENSNRLPQSEILVEHPIKECLIEDSYAQGRDHGSRSNVTQESSALLEHIDPSQSKSDEQIFARIEDEVEKTGQASSKMPDTSPYNAMDSRIPETETTQSGALLDDTVELTQEGHMDTVGVEKHGCLEIKPEEDLTEARFTEDRRVTQIVCYGLGNFSSCVTARFQLALLVLLNSLISPKSCYLYDPNFTDVEKEVLEKLGFSLINKNEEGKRKSSQPTLFFMPHCGKPLYNNLLWANWSLELSNIIILGNSFDNFSERFTDKLLKEEVPYIHKIIPFHREFPLRNSFQYTDIFNDMAFQVFPATILRTAPSTFWANRPEPSYDHIDSVEIITASTSR
ncbi:SRR1-like protein [Lytechinus variegatus]|uniref:SRR1-like protein n=1 Tax=Lytechinus variegatus TaxID=7654 RepID=UPI001BB2B9E7|nr:SRR1-like protein [Lytechinus variegatus]